MALCFLQLGLDLTQQYTCFGQQIFRVGGSCEVTSASIFHQPGISVLHILSFNSIMSVEFDMPPRDTNTEPTFKPSLVNVAGRGLGWRDRDGIFRCVSKVSLKCVAPISLQQKNLVGKVSSDANIENV